MIAFRTDANKYTATGHAMRCMSIAEAVVEQGEEVIFFVSDYDSQKFIESFGYRTVSLDIDWLNMEGELDLLFALIGVYHPSCLVISSYQTTEKYLETVNRQIKTVFIDDLNEYIYPVSAVVNYNIYAERMNYRDAHKEKNTKLFLGTKYAPLRKQFTEVQYEVRDKVENILISTGGTDRYEIAQGILDAVGQIKVFEEVKFHVLRGVFSSDVLVPKAMEGLVIIHRGVSNMAELMAQCDLAVTAGGSTYYELCACGIPSFSFSLSDDQIFGAEEFQRQGIIPYCGDVRNDRVNCINRILNEMQDIICDKTYRKMISDRMRCLVDGMGAKRLAVEIINL